MSQACASSTDSDVGEVREMTTGTSIRAALPSISELTRPDVTSTRPPVATFRRRHRPVSLSKVLCRPTSSATHNSSAPSARAEVWMPCARW